MGAELDAEKRERLLEALASGANMTEAARRSGYSRNHAYRCLQDARFLADLEKRRAALGAPEQAGDEKLALETLRDIAGSEFAENRDRIAAAKALLGHLTRKRPPAASKPAAPVVKVLPGGDPGAASDWLQAQA